MNYEFAALDLFIDKNKDIYFIEANSSPGVLKEYLKVYKNCRPIKELCKLLNKKYKSMAVISKRRWDKSIISKKFEKYFKGKITFCPYKKNISNMKRGSGYLINNKNEKLIPNIILRVAAGRLIAQEKAGIKVINPKSISKLTLDKIKTKKLVKKFTNIKVPKYFRIKNKKHIKKILEKNQKLFDNGFVLKPRKNQKSHGVYVFHSYNEIPKNFRVREEYIIEELIEPFPLFKNKFFEIRSMVINGKYAGSMLFVSPKRPMHLLKEGKTVKTPKMFENKIKKASEEIVNILEKASRK